MFAIVKTGGKQYRVAENDVITVERLPGAAGDFVLLEDVLMVGGATPLIGAPRVSGASVHAELLEQARGPKIISFKKRRRQNSKRKKGHRQDLTQLRIAEILTEGRKPDPTAFRASLAATPGDTQVEAGRDASNLSLISGVGPVLEARLRAAGIGSWADIAAWDADAIAKWDHELNLGGRAEREEWVEQAKELLAGRPPRARIDRAELESGEDH